MNRASLVALLLASFGAALAGCGGSGGPDAGRITPGLYRLNLAGSSLDPFLFPGSLLQIRPDFSYRLYQQTLESPPPETGSPDLNLISASAASAEREANFFQIALIAQGTARLDGSRFSFSGGGVSASGTLARTETSALPKATGFADGRYTGERLAFDGSGALFSLGRAEGDLVGARFRGTDRGGARSSLYAIELASGGGTSEGRIFTNGLTRDLPEARWGGGGGGGRLVLELPDAFEGGTTTVLVLRRTREGVGEAAQ